MTLALGTVPAKNGRLLVLPASHHNDRHRIVWAVTCGHGLHSSSMQAHPGRSAQQFAV